ENRTPIHTKKIRKLLLMICPHCVFLPEDFAHISSNYDWISHRRALYGWCFLLGRSWEASRLGILGGHFCASGFRLSENEDNFSANFFLFAPNCRFRLP